MKLVIMYHGMMNQFMEFGKDNLYCETIKEALRSSHANPWTLRFEVKDVVELDMEFDN